MKKYLCLLLFMISVTALFAVDFTVIIRDKDLEMDLEGALVAVVDTDFKTYSDDNGKASVSVEGQHDRIVLFIQAIGYKSRKVLVRQFSSPVIVEMIMEGVVEGEELVVIEESLGRTDDEVGISTAIDKDTIETTSKIGVIEDVMSSVKMLPGVTYSGGFSSYLSVRGGNLDGLTAVMDGFVVKYPYHWGGAFSIFNPNIVESVKFSAGIFSAKYGQATSGVLEINTVYPDEGFKFRYLNSLSTFEAFFELPLGKNGGMYAGARLTNYDLAFALTGHLMEEGGTTFSRIPYIYDGYFKSFYKPAENIEWYLNAFWGNDGIGVTTLDEDLTEADGIMMDFDFKYSNMDVFANTGTKFLVNDNLFIHILGGYEYWLSSVDGSTTEFGTREYSQEFVDVYTPVESGYSINLTSRFLNDVARQGIQARADADFEVNEQLLWQNGVGGSYDISFLVNEGTYYATEFNGGIPEYNKIEYGMSSDETNILNSFIYTNLSVSLLDDILEIDLGTRMDHTYFMSADMSLNTYPVVNPRLNTRWRLESNSFFEEHTFSFGTGFFSKTPFDTTLFNADMGLQDFDINVPKTFMAILGYETRTAEKYRFKLEGYYKYHFDNSYMNFVETSGSSKREIIVHNDGIGHTGGFDLLLDKKTSRYWDGMLSYSFIYSKFYNPGAEGTPTDGAPRGIWYFKNYHRFHNLNFLLNVKPANWVTFTTKFSFASGTPMMEYGDKQMYGALVENEDGSTSLVEMYTRETFYSDELRTWYSLPLDFKLVFHNYYTNSRLRWEVYIGVEDVLSYLLSQIAPKDNIQTNPYTGEDTLAPNSGFSFIVPSIGFTLTY